LEKATREAAKLTQAALKPQPSTSHAPEIAMQHEPMDCVYSATAEQTSGSSGSGQQGAVDVNVETFHNIFVNNTFGHVCDVCDSIWFKLDLSLITVSQVALLEEEFANERDRLHTFKLCSTCRQALNAKKRCRL
jgi:hypothetical protein